MKKLLIAVLLISSFTACDQTTEEESIGTDTASYFEPELLISDSGLFRNASISATLEEVKMLEEIAPTNEQGGYLYYEYPLPSNNKYTITYSFDDKGLYEIQTDIFIEDTAALKKELKELQSYMVIKFGTPVEKQKSTTIWLIKTNESDEVEIVLKNATAEQKTGAIALSVYDYDYHR